MPESLKADARSKRGKGVRRRVESSSAVPGNWQAFLRIDENKTGFVLVLSKEGGRWQALTTLQVDVLCTNRRDVSSLAPCTHEEADTHMLLHLRRRCCAPRAQ